MQQAAYASQTVQPSTRERVGIFVNTTSSRDLLTKIQRAEQAGVRQIWAQNAGQADLLSSFAVAAAQTERIRLGSAIVPVYTRHPLTMVKQILAVQELAPDRLRLGLGPGNPLLITDAYGLTQTTPLAYLKEYLGIVREILETGKIEHHGTFFKLNFVPRDAFGPVEAQRAKLPLSISAVGLKAFQLAGEIADGAISWVCPVPYLLEQALPALRAGAEAAQRPAPPVIAHMRIVLSDDEETVLAAMRKGLRVSARFGAYTRMFAQAGFPNVVNGDQAETDALARSLVISGSDATIRQRVESLLSNGLDELMLHLVPLADQTSEEEHLFKLVGSLT